MTASASWGGWSRRGVLHAVFPGDGTVCGKWVDQSFDIPADVVSSSRKCQRCARRMAGSGLIRADLLAGFIAKIEVQPDGCWIWRGTLNKAGYGLCYVGDRRERYAHRVTYRQTIGEVPEGLELDHLCNVTSCCNPFHLEPVTSAENKRRAVERRPVPEHGTIDRYWDGCRCRPCGEQATEYNRSDRARRRAEATQGLRPIPHGTCYGYNSLGCRCDECRSARLDYDRERSQGESPSHGTLTGYVNFRCRCAECRAAKSAYARQYEARRKVSA